MLIVYFCITYIVGCLTLPWYVVQNWSVCLSLIFGLIVLSIKCPNIQNAHHNLPNPNSNSCLHVAYFV